MTRPVVLAVDANRRNLALAERFLSSDDLEIRTAATFEEIDEALAASAEIQGAFLDITGFGPDIWPRCQGLHAAGIPFIMLSARYSAAEQALGLRQGARAVLSKPLLAAELSTFVHSLLAVPVAELSAPGAAPVPP
jgi:DNA-binding response OmpR family regulator